MSNRPSVLANVLSLRALRMQPEGDVMIVSEPYATERWSPDLAAYGRDGVRRWRVPRVGSRFAVEGTRVCTLESPSDAQTVVCVRDLAAGAPAADLPPIEIDPETQEVALADGVLYLLVERGILARALRDGAAFNAAAFRVDGSSFAGFSARAVHVHHEYEGLRAFDRITVRERWVREAPVERPALVTDTRVVVCGEQPDGPPRALLCLDADNGAERWSIGSELRPLCVAHGVVVAVSPSQWLFAIDLETGAQRWSQWLGRRCLAACEVPEGGVVQTDDALCELDLDGTFVAWRAVRAAADRRPLIWHAGRLWCGDALDADVHWEQRAAITRPVACELDVPTFAWAEGASFFSPAEGAVDEIRAVIEAARDLDEAWETLALRGWIPDGFVGGARTFQFDKKVTERPSTRGGMLSFAALCARVLRSEALMHESLARAARWRKSPVDVLPRWCFWIVEHEAETQPDAWAAALDAVTGSVPGEVIERIRAAQEGHTLREKALWTYPWIERAVLGDALWRTAVRNGLRVRWGACAGEGFESLPNPFAPLIELASEGFGWTPSGALTVQGFRDDLRTKWSVPEIPF